jgi:hypothetical protein
LSNIRYTDKTQTSITVVVDQLTSGAATYNDINLYVNGTFKVAMQDLSGAGGTTGNYRTGTYTVSGLSANTTYSLEARIRKVAGGTVETVSINVTTDSPTISVGSVNNLSSSSITKSGFSISWSSALNATSYQILLNGNSYYTSNTYYNFSGLSPSTTYSIQVRGYTGSNNGNYTSVMYVTTSGDVVIPQVTGLYSSNVLATGFKVNWNLADGATSYQVEYKIQSSSSWSVLYTANTYYNFAGFNPETYYDVRVKGYSGTNIGSYSSILSVRTQSTLPSPLAWTDRSSGQNFNLTAKEWNDMTSKINAWRKYQNSSATTINFPVAFSGNDLTASMFNQAVNAITALNPPYLPAAIVGVGETVTATKINRISDSLDSLIP